ncbi:hypothetical protein EVA_09187 [gut metagenome]|uniref:Uncharacterized protein n=1 Tax=gut metagenome TaxID=749906 RepID=J9GRH2_9ZZZZ
MEQDFMQCVATFIKREAKVFVFAEEYNKTFNFVKNSITLCAHILRDV